MIVRTAELVALVYVLLFCLVIVVFAPTFYL